MSKFERIINKNNFRISADFMYETNENNVTRYAWHYNIYKMQGGFKLKEISGHIYQGAAYFKAGKPTPPELASILSNLMIDAYYGTLTFDDFCDNLGCDNDSLKVLNNYLDCQREYKKVVNFLGYELYHKLLDNNDY